MPSSHYHRFSQEAKGDHGPAAAAEGKSGEDKASEGSLFTRVQQFCMSKDFEREFEEFAESV